MELSLADILQFIGGGSMITLALSVLKVVRDSRDELRDLRKDLGRTDSNSGLIARVNRIEDEQRSLRDWCVRKGYDTRTPPESKMPL